MILAQSVAEYGALSSVVAGIQHAAYEAGQWIEDQGPAIWLAILALLCVILIVRRRRRS